MCRSETYSDEDQPPDNVSDGGGNSSRGGALDMTKFRSAYLFVSVKENIQNQMYEGRERKK